MSLVYTCGDQLYTGLAKKYLPMPTYLWSILANYFFPYCRDHPSTIKRRFFSVTCMMLVAPFFSQYFFTEQTLAKGNVHEQLGLRWPGTFQATTVPLFLTAILFLGPLTMQFFSGIWKLYAGIYKFRLLNLASLWPCFLLLTGCSQTKFSNTLQPRATNEWYSAS